MNTNDISFTYNSEVLFEYAFHPEQTMIIPRVGEVVVFPYPTKGTERYFMVMQVIYEYVEDGSGNFQGTVVTVKVEIR